MVRSGEVSENLDLFSMLADVIIVNVCVMGVINT